MSRDLMYLLLFAVLDIPLAMVALFYGRSKPGGSDPTARRVLYAGAAALWVSVVVAAVAR